MSKKNDDSIERIFRKAVTQYETTFVEGDWLKMEKMLDEEANRRAAVRSKRIRGAGYTITGLMGLVVAVYFLALNNPSDPVVRLNPVSPELQAEEDPNSNGNVHEEVSSSGLLSSSSVQNDSMAIDGTKKTSPVVESDNNTSPSLNKREKVQNEVNSTESKLNASAYPVVKKNSISRPPVALKDNKAIINQSPGLTSIVKEEKVVDGGDQLQVPSAADSRAPATVPDESAYDPALQAVSPVPPVVRAADTSNSSDFTEMEKVVTINSTSLESAVNSPDTALNSSPLHDGNEMQETSPGNVVPEQKQDSINTQETGLSNTLADKDSSQNNRKENNKPSSHWSVGVLFAPEFSTTRLNHYSSPGESFGLRIGYQLSKRFSVNTGIIRSTKKYKDNAREYNTNPNYWKNRTNGIIPEQINGRCLVIEVPLDIQFNVIQNQKSRVFASTGISSYFMLSQSYNYNFETPNPGADNGWSTSESESYWFGVGMLSAGYERKIHPALMIGIEPYLKVALTEIGWPNINLLSTGAYVTLRYKFIQRPR